MTTPNTTNIPAPRVPFVDERTGLISREWFRFLNNQFQLTGGGTTAISLADLELAPYSDAATEAELTVTQSRVEALELAPRPPELTPVSFGSFFSTQTQVATVINTATAISYNNAGTAYGITPRLRCPAPLPTTSSFPFSWIRLQAVPATFTFGPLLTARRLLILGR